MTIKSISESMAGKRFGRLLVLSRHGTQKNGRVTWNCVCDCGNKPVVVGIYLRAGSTKSCGCWRREDSRKRNTTHGMSKNPLYKLWLEMIRRCKNPSCEHYGAIGISVCDRWVNSFDNFIADMGPRPNGLSLDRINPFGNYEPSNCRWATAKEQGLNKRGHAAIAKLKTFKSEFQIESILSLPG